MKRKVFVAFWAGFILLVATRQVGRLRGGQQDPQGSASSVQSTSFEVGPAQQIILSNLPPASSEAAVPVEEISDQEGMTDEEYLRLKQEASLPIPGASIATQPATEPMVPGRALQGAGPLTPTADTNYTPPVTSRQTDACATNPPDMALAANQDFVVQVINACLAIINPATGMRVSQTTLSTFFGVAAGHNIGDPRALYDSSAERFIVIAEDFSAGPPRNLLFATSNGRDPTQAWQVRTLGMNASDCADFPTLGQTLQESGDPLGAIYVGFNVLGCNAPFALLDDVVWIIPKTQAYGGHGVTITAFFNFRDANGVLLDTLQPASVMNKLDRPRAEFLLNTYDLNGDGGANTLCRNGCRGLFVWAIVNGVPGGGQQASASMMIANTQQYRLAPMARQPGCAAGACLVDTGKPKISGGVSYSSGSLFAVTTTRTTANPATASVLWWEVRPALNDQGTITAADLRNQDCFFCGGFANNGSAYYGTIQPDSEGNFTLVYSYSSDSTFPSLAYSTRRVTQQRNAMRDVGILLDAGVGLYTNVSNGRNRWGDYTATAPHLPGNARLPATNAYWFSGQYALGPLPVANGGRWATAIGRNGYTSPNQP